MVFFGILSLVFLVISSSKWNQILPNVGITLVIVVIGKSVQSWDPFQEKYFSFIEKKEKQKMNFNDGDICNEIWPLKYPKTIFSRENKILKLEMEMMLLLLLISLLLLLNKLSKYYQVYF